jgi:hypothetical protein
MVYFKLSASLVKYVADSGLQGLVGCQVYCDRQYISFQELEQVVAKLRYQYTQAAEALQKR